MKIVVTAFPLFLLSLRLPAEVNSAQDMLIKAILHGDLQKMETLLSLGVDPNLPDPDGQTPLTGVTDQGSLSISSPASYGSGTPETPPVTAPSGSGAAVRHRSLPERPPIPFLRCVICGRKGRFVDPFPRYPRCRRRNL